MAEDEKAKQKKLAEEQFNIANGYFFGDSEKKIDQNMDKARSHFEKAIKLDPGFHKAHNNFAVLLHKFHDYDKAEKHYKLATTDLDYGLGLKNYAVFIERRHKDVPKAIDLFRKSLQCLEEESNADTHYRLAVCLDNPLRVCTLQDFPITPDYERNNKEEAIKHYKKAMAINPFFVDAYLRLANLIDKERSDEGYEVYTECIKNNPECHQAHNDVGALLKNYMQQYDEAESHFKAAIKIKPEFASAHLNLASILEIKKDYEGAEEHYEIALKLYPDDVEALCNLGALYTNHMKKHQDAAKLMKRALKLDPDDLDINFNLAEILEVLDDVKGAIKHYNKALSLDPNDSEIKERLATLKNKKVDAKKTTKKRAANEDVASEDPPKKKEKPIENPQTEHELERATSPAPKEDVEMKAGENEPSSSEAGKVVAASNGDAESNIEIGALVPPTDTPECPSAELVGDLKAAE